MSLPVYRLRRLLAITAIVFIAVVTGMYYYARSRTRNVLNEVPNKLGIEIKQTANGFQFSKSDGKRTLFTVQASDVKEFKLNGRAELHNVSIILYGRDSSRFDQIYGDDFAYDPKTGDVTAKGDVQIDLVANPAGLASPDQSTPKELKNPIHLKTRDLIFNRESGNAWTDARVEFRTPQASGSALGVRYNGKINALILGSQIRLELSAPNAAVVEAEHGTITNDPREVVLDRPHLTRETGTIQADRAVFHLNSDNHVDRVEATGNVSTVTRSTSMRAAGDAKKAHAPAGPPSEIVGHADKAEFLMATDQDQLRNATLSGDVHFEQTGTQPMEGQAGRVLLEFAERNQLEKVRAMDGAHLVQRSVSNAGGTSQPQEFDLAAPAIDFIVAQGHVLQRAQTSGAAQITLSSLQGQQPPSPAAQRTVVTADNFEAQFGVVDGRNRLSTVHGAPNARILSSQPGDPDRISNSDAIDATFSPQGNIDSITQQGHFTYADTAPPEKRVQAWASKATYTPSDTTLVLTGGPRVTSGGMATSASTVRINRSSGEAFAEGDVKSTYSELKEQPGGALLASSSPIHVTSRTMTLRKAPGDAVYSGKARLWQDANVIEAQSIEFDRDRRFVLAQGTPNQPVQTILVQPEKSGNSKSAGLNVGKTLALTAAKLTYTDAERKVHYEGGVQAKSTDFTATSATLDAFLLPRSATTTAHSSQTPGQLDHLVAEGDVLIQQPNRRAQGQKLVYTAADDKFVLSGGPPSIFDAEQGKITGVSLTFFRRDDRVLVEGEASTPVVTTTRVAR